MTNIHAAIDAVIIGIAAALAIGMYLYGQFVARREHEIKQAAPLEALRAKCRAHHRTIFRLQQTAADLTAENAELRRQLSSQADQSLEDHYTLLRAGRELQLASETFHAMRSSHAMTAGALSRECYAMAGRYKAATPIPEAPDAPVEKMEKAA